MLFNFWVSFCCHVYVVLLSGRLFDVKMRKKLQFTVFAGTILLLKCLEQCDLVKLFEVFASFFMLLICGVVT